MVHRKEIITVVAVSVCFFLFAFFIDFSVDKLVDIQTSLLKMVLSQSGTAAILNVFSVFVSSFLALIFLVLGFMVLVGYAISIKDKRKSQKYVGIVSGIAGAVIFLFMFKFTITSLFLAVSVIISSVYIIPLSRTYEQELKRWKLFRIGSNSSGKVLLIFNVLVSVGILVAISMNMSYYENSFLNGFSSTVKTISVQQSTALADTYIESYRSSAIAAIDKTYPNLPAAQRQALVDSVNQQADDLKKNLLDEINAKSDELSRNAVQNLPMFQTYMTWLPILTAFTVFVALEFLRSLILSNMAGIFSAITIKAFGKGK